MVAANKYCLLQCSTPLRTKGESERKIGADVTSIGADVDPTDGHEHVSADRVFRIDLLGRSKIARSDTVPSS